MTRMLALSGQLHAHRGPYVAGLSVPAERSRRIGRARERAAWRRELTR